MYKGINESRKLTLGMVNWPNVSAPTADYPSGRSVDNNGSQNGTPLNVAVLGDMEQFYEKMLREMGVTPNGLPDNTTNGWQLYSAFLSATRRGIVYQEVSAGFSLAGAPFEHIVRLTTTGSLTNFDLPPSNSAKNLDICTFINDSGNSLKINTIYAGDKVNGATSLTITTGQKVELMLNLTATNWIIRMANF